jgi:hypothetical protein
MLRQRQQRSCLHCPVPQNFWVITRVLIWERSCIWKLSFLFPEKRSKASKYNPVPKWKFGNQESEDVVREGSFTGVRELERDIEQYLAERNLNPKPYRWRAEGEEILRKIKRAHDDLGIAAVSN